MVWRQAGPCWREIGPSQDMTVTNTDNNNDNNNDYDNDSNDRGSFYSAVSHRLVLAHRDLQDQ